MWGQGSGWGSKLCSMQTVDSVLQEDSASQDTASQALTSPCMVSLDS